jgi:hypothetical protein
MIGSVQSSGNSPYRQTSNAALKEKWRAEYDPKTKQFQPMGKGETKEIDHMAEIEGVISKKHVPTDYTSPKFLQTLATKNAAKGNPLKTDTKGVGAYFSGNPSLFPNFIRSISRAQSQL